MGSYIKVQSSFAKFFTNIFSYNVYDLRKAMSSRIIAEGITRKTKKLEYIQGHSIGVILDHYNVYSFKKIIIKKKILEIKNIFIN